MHVCAAAAIVTNSEPKSSLYYTEPPNGYLRQAPNGWCYPLGRDETTLL
jgi:hypothetical protein